MIEYMAKAWENPLCPQLLTAYWPHLQEVCDADSSLG